MRGKKASWGLLFIAAIGLGVTAACGGGEPATVPDVNVAASPQESAGEPGKTGLRTATPAPDKAAGVSDTDPGRWTRVASFQGTFAFTLESDIEEQETLSGGSQTVRSNRTATGTITLKRLDEETFSGEGTMTWSVDDLIEVRGENDEIIRTAAAQGAGEATLDPGETVLWMDSGAGIYGMAIFPEGLYDAMEVQGTEDIVGLAPVDEVGPLGYLGLMDTAGIAGWFEGLPLPASGLDLGGTLELPDGSIMSWTLQPGS